MSIDNFCSNFTHENYNKLPRYIQVEFVRQARELRELKEAREVRERGGYRGPRAERYLDIINYDEECRRFHNEIKENLITKYISHRKMKTVMDLGSGKGGDIHKYKKASIRTLYCVEPNKEFIKEMMARIPSAKLNYHIESIHAKAEDLDTISKAIAERERPQVISMFFSLSFFFENNETLDKLIATIQNMGPQLFIGTTIDGGAVMRLLKGKKSSKVQLEDVSIKCLNRDENLPIGTPVIFQYKNSATVDAEQIEYLVNFPLFVSRMEQAGYELIENELFQPPEFFRNESKLFSQLYATFAFQKI